MSQQIESMRGPQATDSESRDSTSPLISDTTPSLDKSEGADLDTSQAGEGDNGAKPRKRDFFKFGKKSELDPSKSKTKEVPAANAPRSSIPHIAPTAALRPVSPLRSTEGLRASSPRSHPYGAPSSPGQGIYSSSPRMHSPASSQIFERNVQEDVMPPQASPQIPSHIITENHIPPALDATSAAITNKQLDPDLVEIVTHATHQPAAVTITGAGDQSLGESFHQEMSHTSHRQDADNVSNYAALDNADVRRLSFISFADVVHAEHAEAVESGDQPSTRRDSIQPHSAVGGIARSPSPMRSPLSSPGHGTSPPSSVSPSVKGLEAPASPGRRGLSSPIPGQMSPPGGELNIETMRQALRSPASGDLSGYRSLPLSAVGEDGMFPSSPLK
jgi:hypothetical protein